MTFDKRLDSDSTLTQQQIFDLRTMASQSYFDQSPMLNATIPPGVKGYSMGITGETVPYTIANDNLVSGIILGCFILAIITTARCWQFLGKGIRTFFYSTRQEDVANQTSAEIRYQIVMTFITILLVSTASYMYITDTATLSHIFINDHVLGGILIITFSAYLLTKWFITFLVNAVFFDKKKNIHWIHTKLFLTTLEGLLIFPLVLLQVYFSFIPQNALFWFLSVLFLNKIFTFYKYWSIFFRQNGGLLQTFLYFCALEITPLLAFCGTGLLTINYLKVNF